MRRIAGAIGLALLVAGCAAPEPAVSEPPSPPEPSEAPTQDGPDLSALVGRQLTADVAAEFDVDTSSIVTQVSAEPTGTILSAEAEVLTVAVPETYTLAATTTVEGTSFTVDLATNLPPGAEVDVILSRMNRICGEAEDRFFAVESPAEAVVVDGDGSGSVTLDIAAHDAAFADWIEAWAAEGDCWEALDTVEVTASFYPGVLSGTPSPQEPLVLRMIGGDAGDALESSPQAAAFGELTDTPSWTLKLEEQVVLPFPG